MKKQLSEQTGGAGGTTSATFQPAVGPAGAASASGAFPGGKKKMKLIKRKFPKLNEIKKKLSNRKSKITAAVDFEKRVKSSSIG